MHGPGKWRAPEQWDGAGSESKAPKAGEFERSRSRWFTARVEEAPHTVGDLIGVAHHDDLVQRGTGPGSRAISRGTRRVEAGPLTQRHKGFGIALLAMAAGEIGLHAADMGRTQKVKGPRAPGI